MRASLGVPAGQGVVEGNEIPYQPWALGKKKENYANRRDRGSGNEVLPCRACRASPTCRIRFRSCRRRRTIADRSTNTATRRGTIYMNGTPHPRGPIDSGWAIRAAAGKATRWSST